MEDTLNEDPDMIEEDAEEEIDPTTLVED